MTSQTESITKLIDAIRERKNEIVEQLLDNHNVISIHENRNTLLHYAVQIKENDKIVELLIKKGANVNVINGYRMTPLHTAVSNIQNFKIVKLLLEKGADLNIVDIDNNTPLFHAIKKQNNDKIVKLLIDKMNKNDLDMTETHILIMQLCINILMKLLIH